MSSSLQVSTEGHKLLVANRGEIAVRIIQAAKRLRLPTVAIYTTVDSTAPHVQLADESVLLRPDDDDPASNAKGYLDSEVIANICTQRNVTLVHPGYGFLSENAGFARLLENRGVKLLGPSARVIEDMGLKHRARKLAVEAGVPIVPGCDIVDNIGQATAFAADVGYPVMIKATAGGGGMGLVVCMNEEELISKFEGAKQRSKSLFANDGVFLERFYPSARHIEIQIFGDGLGHVIHMGERECSVQRRHQKIFEESPSPFLFDRPTLREEMCAAAVELGKAIKYKSAGTVEFLVDDQSGSYFFLEMNTRLQVEHGVTEMIYPGLDIVELMIYQGILEVDNEGGLPEEALQQKDYGKPRKELHAIEARVYSENPASNFVPSPGILQYVEFPPSSKDLRIDTWVSTGTVVSSFYDPLLAKIIVNAPNRSEAISKLRFLLKDSEDYLVGESHGKVAVCGPPNNIEFLAQVLEEDLFKAGRATTEWVDHGEVSCVPHALTVLTPGLNATVQDLPGRKVGLGIPTSGPMDDLAFRAANILVGNNPNCEGFEIVVPSAKSPLAFSILFHVESIIAVTGANAQVKVDGKEATMWSQVSVSAGSKVAVYGAGSATETSRSGGLRVYMAVWKGFPHVPSYLASKSTSMGNGGYQGRALQTGDVIRIRSSETYKKYLSGAFLTVPDYFVPKYPSQWIVYALPGPHDDTEFLTAAGIEAFYARQWKVSSASNRMGIRLEAVPLNLRDAPSEPVLAWARENGGEGGSHPSNILDTGYALGSINLNGETPVILTCEGPSMGGYACVSTIVSAERWKLGQFRPGDFVQFVRVDIEDAVQLRNHYDKWLNSLADAGNSPSLFDVFDFKPTGDYRLDPKLHVVESPDRYKVVFRQAGDSSILVEFGPMKLDFLVRARVHGFEMAAKARNIVGIIEFCACIRSTMCHFDPKLISQNDLLDALIEIEASLPSSVEDMVFPGRKLSFPIVLDDKWNREALDRYMRSSRDQAVYLPSNIDYLARNNGLKDGAEALKVLIASPWLVFGVGFYLACPFLVPVDPRCRIVGQKMNPSRTFTPRGAIGIAGVVAAIYPVESPGGYQLYGRTLPAWQNWGAGPDFAADRPWLLRPFDQVVFEEVSEKEYVEMEKLFDSGRYKFKIEECTFSMKDYVKFISTIESEVVAFQAGQATGVALEEAREKLLWEEWQTREREKAKHKDGPNTGPSGQNDIPENARFASASVSGSVWKIVTSVGSTINSAEDVLVILEAMKMEIKIQAGEENVGGKVVGLGHGIAEGATVRAGDVLVIIE